MAEKEDVVADIDVLREEAKALGIKSWHVMGEEKLTAAIADANAGNEEKADSETETGSAENDALSEMCEEVETAIEPKLKDVIAKGKAITSKKGVLGPGAEVKAGYLNGGEATLKALREKGFIVKG